MGIVREYIFSLMIVSACCGIVSILAPDNTSLNKYVHFLISLIVTVILLSPIDSVLGLIPELMDSSINIEIANDENDSYDYTEALIKETCDNISEEIKLQIRNKFNVEPNEVVVCCDTDDIENITVNKIDITYSSDNELLFRDTVKYVVDLMGDDCEVRCTYENSE